MRRALAAAALAALAAPAGGLADSQQVLVPGPTPYATTSPPLVTSGWPPWATLTFKVHASSDQRVLARVGPDGSVVSLHVLHRLHLTGTGDYLVVVSAPASDVRAAAGSQSQPGLRQGQILWAGFSSKRKLLAFDATLRPRPAAPFLPLRLDARRDGDRYTLTLTNATSTSQVAFQGAASRAELAHLLDQTRAQALAGERLDSAFVTIDGPVTQRSQRAQVVAPLRVEGELRFPEAPSSATGASLHGRSVRFAVDLDGETLAHRIEVRGGGEPHLRIEARPTGAVRLLDPPGARSWKAAVARRPLPAAALLRRLLDARFDVVRSDQYQAYLDNPDPSGTNRTVYAYETAAAAPKAAAGGSNTSSGGDGALMILLAVGGSVVVAAGALVAWAHS